MHHREQGGIARKEWQERFADEGDPFEDEKPEFYGCCGSCYEFKRCDIKGHEDIGFCQDAQEFCRVDDEVECETYWERI